MLGLPPTAGSAAVRLPLAPSPLALSGGEIHFGSMAGAGANLFGAPPVLVGSSPAPSSGLGPSFSPPALPPALSPPSLGRSLSSNTSPGLGAFMRQAVVDAGGCLCLEPSCSCCRPVPPPMQRKGCKSILLHADPKMLAAADDEHVPAVLQRLLGGEGLLKVFGRPDAHGARRIRCRGMNHVFMVAHAGLLAKCISPKAEHHSEAQEAERLRQEVPSLTVDEHALFPVAVFACQAASPFFQLSAAYEITVFLFLDGCHSVGDLVRMFERSHPSGCLQSTAACQSFRGTGHCEHLAHLRSLFVQQVPRLSARFQKMHNRRHGDFKADNVLIDRRGIPRLADFLSPFCTSCDRGEFVTSVTSISPIIVALQGEFERAWQGEMQREGQVHVLEAGDAARNVVLMDGLERLAASCTGVPMLGPMPSLLSGLGLSPLPARPLSVAHSFNVAPSPPPQEGAPAVAMGSMPLASPSRRASVVGGRAGSLLVSAHASPLRGSCDGMACFIGFQQQALVMPQFPFTGQPSPHRGLRNPATPALSPSAPAACSLAPRPDQGFGASLLANCGGMPLPQPKLAPQFETPQRLPPTASAHAAAGGHPGWSSLPPGAFGAAGQSPLGGGSRSLGISCSGLC